MTTIEVKNDYMLGRQNETILYYKCMELEQENKQLKVKIGILEELIDYYIASIKNREELEGKINKVACYLGHELYGHILQNDEETWNEEYYTDGKLDYRKLLIHLLEEVFEILEVDGSKWYEYEEILGGKNE